MTTWPLDVARYLTLNYYHQSRIRLISTMATWSHPRTRVASILEKSKDRKQGGGCSVSGEVCGLPLAETIGGFWWLETGYVASLWLAKSLI